jgi:hypothetical protein
MVANQGLSIRVKLETKPSLNLGSDAQTLLWPLNNCSFKSGNCFRSCSISAEHLCVFQKENRNSPLCHHTMP